MKIRFLAAFYLLVAATVSVAAQNKPFSFDDMLATRRVSDPRLSPDGRVVAFTIGVVDEAANKTVTQIYTMSADGTNKRQITEGTSSNSSPRWSPDGRQIAFVANGQIWRMKADGSDRKQVTTISTGAANPVWSPDGKWIAFNSDVYPECASDECNKLADAEAENGKVKAKVTTRLLYRHWVEWRDRKRTHVFVVPSDGGTAVDFTPGDFDSPPYAASTGADYAFSPDSREIAFLRNPDKVEAISTNSDIYVASLYDKRQQNITATNKGYDAAPAYTPDGKYLIYRSQMTGGFESDRWRIMRYNRLTGETVELTRGFDRQAGDFQTSDDSKTVYFSAEDNGRVPIFSVPVEPDFRLRIATFVKPVVPQVSAGSMSVSPGGDFILFTDSSFTAPAEIMRAQISSGSVSQLTRENTAAFANFGLQKAEDLEWQGSGSTRVRGFLIKPANFDASKKYPLLVLIHGGPQGAWNNSWGYRWNPQVFANAGYVVFMPNPRGSTGYGQQFINEVTADWGGRAYTDIMNGVAEVIKRPFIDKSNIGAAGASYGGYMVDWILGHNNDPRFKFKTLVSHAGVYNLESMAGATEELWFVNWEFKGMPWQNPVNYTKWSPNKFAKNFATPTLVTAGELDYRVPVDQSLQLFTALQLNNVESKLIVFPDEGHWITKPQNSEFWYRNVIDWLNKYLKNQ